MKKLVCLLLVLLLCMGTFASCKKATNNQENNTVQTETAEDPAKETLEIEETLEAPPAWNRVLRAAAPEKKSSMAIRSLLPALPIRVALWSNPAS